MVSSRTRTARSAPTCGLDLLERHRQVVLAERRLGARGEDRLGQPDPSCRPGGSEPRRRRRRAVVGQAAAGEVGAADALHRQHLQAAHQHGASGDGVRHVGGEDVVGDHVGELLEPPQRQLREDLALVRDLAVEDVVERRDPVGGHQQQLVRAGPAGGRVDRRVEVTDLARVDVGVAGQLQRLGRDIGRHGDSFAGGAARGAARPRQPAGTPGTATSPREAASAMSVRWCPPSSAMVSSAA